MKIQLSDHFTYGKLFRFAIPSVMMMIFTSIYGVADGFFVSNYVGQTPFAAINFISPILIMLGTGGIMFGTGGSALVSKTLGEGNIDKANRLFSFLIYFSVGCSIVLGIVGIAFLRPIAILLGAQGEMLGQCILYGYIILAAEPFYFLQMEFQTFFVTAERPKFGLLVTIAAGITNFILDALFIVVFHWGISGAALATAISQVVGGIVPLIYFLHPNKSSFRLTKTKFYGRDILKVCANGSSELMNGISSSFISILYNVQLMKYGGEDGVAAFGVMMYVTLVFVAVFTGYSNGTAPVTSYHYGALNHSELKNLFRKGIKIITISSIVMFVLAEIFARPLTGVFINKNMELMEFTIHGLRIYATNFLFCGIAVYASSLFTALNNGAVSAAIAFLRAFVFQLGTIFLFPALWDVDGIWYSIAAAELLATVAAVIFLATKRSKYQY